MARRFILVINSPEGKYCHRGEGTQTQILKDLKNSKIDPSNAEVLPVYNSRLTKDISLGVIIGVGVGVLLNKIYENLHKRYKKHR